MSAAGLMYVVWSERLGGYVVPASMSMFLIPPPPVIPHSTVKKEKCFNGKSVHPSMGTKLSMVVVCSPAYQDEYAVKDVGR